MAPKESSTNLGIQNRVVDDFIIRGGNEEV
jgi:hypothetical protein